MPNVRSFAPLADRRSRVLVLGSMPGVASLQAQEYYAHPRNAFWPIMAQVCGFDAGLPYPDRVRQLLRAGVAVWDVLATCHRPGSADADIDEASIEVNDFALLFQAHPRIRSIYFNGAKAESCFRRLVLPHLSVTIPALQGLPSTSPANASYSFDQKAAAWRVIRDRLYDP